MRPHPKALLLLVAASAALSFSAACHKKSGGSDVTSSPTPTPAAPANVAASAGNHTLHVSWDAVTGATGYRVYIAPQAFTSTAGITPVFVSATVYDATGVANWVTDHVRVTALDGVLQSALSAEASAMPNAGYVVTSHVQGGSHSVAWFHGDESDV
ncbi:MAG TPA: hypothetical protein VMV18_12045, partial [bacterium]|nr:hypothetical protein [bacterium]